MQAHSQSGPIKLPFCSSLSLMQGLIVAKFTEWFELKI